MNTINFDWRIIAAVVLLFLVIFSRNPYTNIVVLAIGAGWAIQAGIAPWRSRGVLGSSKVTYWRGQRIVSKPKGRGRLALTPVQILVSALYVLIGLGLALTAVLIFIGLIPGV